MRSKLILTAATLFLIAGCAGKERRETTAIEIDEQSTGTSSGATVDTDEAEVGSGHESEGPDSARVRPGTGGGTHTGAGDPTDTGTSR